MVDNPITGSSEFSDWASETIQKEIKRLLEKQLKSCDTKKMTEYLKKIEENTRALKGKGTGGSGGASGIDFTKTVKELDLKRNASSGRSSDGSSSKAKSTVAALMSGVTGGDGVTRGGAGGGGGPIGINEAKSEETLSAKKAASGLWDLTKSVSASTIGLLSLMGSLGRYVGNSIDAYRELLGVGQDFTGSMIEMRRSSADAGMGFDTFVKIMKENSTVIKAAGVGTFIALQNQVRSVNKGFGQFGFTLDEVGNITADYMERQIRAGRFEELTNTQRALEVQRYMGELSMLSKITGRHRDEMMKDAKAITQDTDVRVAAGILGADGAKRFKEGLNKALPGMTAVSGEFADSLKDVTAKSLTFGNIGMSEFGRVAGIIGGDFVDGVNGFTDALKRGESGSESLAKIYDSLGKMNDDTSSQLAQMARAGDDGAMKIMGMIGELEKMSDTQEKELADQLKISEADLEAKLKVMNAQRDAEQETTNRLLDMQSSWGKITGKIEGVLIDQFAPIFTSLINGLLPLFQDNEAQISAAFDSVNEMLKGWSSDFQKWVADGGIKKAIDDVVSWVKDMDFAAIKDGASSIISAFTFLADNIVGISVILGTVWAAFKVVGIAIALFGSAITAPIAAIIAGVVGLVGALTYLWLKSDDIGEWLSDTWNGITDSLSNIGDTIKNAVGTIWDAITGIDWAGIFTGALQGLFDFFTFLPRKLMGLIGEAFGLEGVTNFAKDPIGTIGDTVSGWFGDSNTPKAEITPPAADYKEIPRIKPENIKQIAQAAGTTVQAINEGSVDKEAQLKIETLAGVGNETALKILEQLERANKLHEQSLTANTSIANDTKKISKGEGLI